MIPLKFWLGKMMMFSRMKKLLFVILVPLIATAVVFASIVSADDGYERYGYLESFPEGFVGDWVIGGQTYIATAATEFYQDEGVFAVGTCIEVEYVPNGNIVLELETEEAYKCTGNGGDDDDTYREFEGIVESFPAGLVGSWTVSGEVFTATGTTQFEQDEGPFFEGACVEVKYINPDWQAVEIETQDDDDDCDQDGDGQGDGERKIYGLLESSPPGLIGTWVVSGTTYTADAETDFEAEEGDFIVGACISVEYVLSDTTRLAGEIETEEPYYCSSGNTATNELYGRVDSYPEPLFGTWVINGQNFMAEPGITELEQDEGDFALNGCVNVEYFTLNGVNTATEIETEDDEDCDGNEDDYSDRPVSQVYATIDAFPLAPYIGMWTVGGFTYTAVEATDFDQDSGVFAVGGCVEAEFVTQNGERLLQEVDTELA